MDLVKAKKVIQKNFKDFSVKGSIDEETLVVLICADLIREDMAETTPAPTRSNNRRREETNGNQQPTGGSQGRNPLHLDTLEG